MDVPSRLPRIAFWFGAAFDGAMIVPLLLTAFPVVAGLVAAGIYAVASDLVRLGFMLPVFVSQGVAGALFVTAYLRAGEAAAAGAEHTG